MKPLKRSVAVVIGRPDGAFLIVRRPQDPDDPLAGAWGLPAVTLRDGEDERAAVARAGRVKLGVELAAGWRLGEKTADRGGYVLRLADYAAVVTAGVPAVPQPDGSVTQYTALRYTTDPGTLADAAARGSLCAQVFLDCRRTGQAQLVKRSPEATSVLRRRDRLMIATGLLRRRILVVLDEDPSPKPASPRQGADLPDIPGGTAVLRVTEFSE